MGIRGILKQASILFFRDEKLMTSSVILLLPIIFLSLFLHLTAPLLSNVLHSADDDSSKIAIAKVIIFTECVGSVILVIYYATFLFEVIFTVYHTNDVYMKKSTSLKELLSRTALTWKKVAISGPSLFVGVCYCCLLIHMMLVFEEKKAYLGWLAYVCATHHVYSTVIWTLRFVVLLLEECDKGKAYDIATSLIGGGNVRVYLTLFLMLVSAPVAHLLLFHVRHHYHSEILRYVMECLLVLLISIWQRFIFMFFTVFCFEKKKKKA